MKKVFTIMLMIVMIVVSVEPTYSFAQKDQGLEKVIKLAKEKFDIPAKFTEFDYDVYTVDEKKVWNMCWHSKDSKDGSIEISINDKGRVISYYFNKYEKHDKNKLPKYSEEKGKKIADDFIKNIDESLFSQLNYQKNYQTQRSGEYRYYYIRMINNIPFYENNMMVEVDKDNGNVERFYCNWDDEFYFPNPQKIISSEEAQDAFKNKLGLELIYKYRYDEKTIKPYLVYTTKYNKDACIDAFTAEKLEINAPMLYERAGAGMMAKEVSNESAQISLSPEELKAVNEASKLISKEDAESIARNTKILELSEEFKLIDGNLSKDWPMQKEYTWHLSFNQKKEENGEKTYNYVNVGVDAITGKIKSFYMYDNHKEDEKAIFDKDKSKKEVEKFLKTFANDKYVQTEFEENDYYNYYIENDKKPLSYTFKYTRKVNNVPFRDNGITVNYNAVTGKVTSFDLRWFDVDFPKTKNIASLDKAYNKMFKDIGLKLQYKSSLENAKNYNQKNDRKIKLVYGIKTEKPVIFHGESLKILNYDGLPYKEAKDIAYTDIDGHFAQEAIQSLAKSGIGFEEDRFKPDEKIIQKDFFSLIVKISNYYGSNGNDDEAINEMYEYLIREKIVRENEKLPNANVTKEDSVKFIIRALKYDEVAKIEGIYKYPFKDIDRASKDLIGHITIANGLGIIKGNNDLFEPKKEITRGEVAVMIYQYLKR